MRRTILAALAGVLLGAVLMLALPGTPTQTQRSDPRLPRLEPVHARTLLAWTPRRLPSGLAARIGKQPGVAAVVEVRSGTAWLSAWASSTAAFVSAPPGLRIPMEIAAAEPMAFARFVPPDRRAALGRLSRGGAILGQAAAALRKIGPGGRLRFGTTELSVIDVFPDELIGAHEALLAATTAAPLGVTLPRYALVALDGRASMRSVEDRIHELAPLGTPLRVRAPGETPTFRHGDAVLPPVRLKELFGEFAAAPSGGNLRVDTEWAKNNISRAPVPVFGAVTCNTKILPQLRAALEEIVRRGLDHLIDRSDFGGCYFPRFLNSDPDAGISHHSWGVAFDINVSANPFGASPHMDTRLVDVFERWGFTWGGRWLVPDSMHFEFLRFPLSPKG